MLEPARYYRLASDVIRDRRFSDEEKLAILVAWESVAGEGLLKGQIAEVRREIHKRQSP